MLLIMPLTVIRSSYSFEPKTVDNLNWLSKQWNISKSETLRRLIDRGAEAEARSIQEKVTPLAALQALQKDTLSAEVAKTWLAEINESRKAYSQREEKQWISYTSTPTI